jgi:hypothetical protein
VWGGKPWRWQPKPPPPPKVVGLKWRVPHRGTRQNPPGPANTRYDPPPITWPGEGGKGGDPPFSKCPLIKNYFKKLISHNRHAKLAPSLLQCQSLPISFLRALRRENESYIVTQAYKRPAKRTCLSQLHYILQATSLRKSVKTRTKPATTAHVEQ